MNTEQLEISLNVRNDFRAVRPAARRQSRARWWFSQMHAVVDRALDWKPAAAGRPEQTYIPLRSERLSSSN